MSIKMQVNKIGRMVLGTVAGLGLLVTTSTTPLNAATIGGAETQGKGKFSISADGEFGSREMKSTTMNFDSYVDSSSTSSVHFTGQPESKTKFKSINREMVKVSYGLLDSLDVYAMVGTAQGKIQKDISGTIDWVDGLVTGKAALDGNMSYKLKNALAYGFGAKFVKDISHGFLIGLNGQFLTHKNSYNASASATYRDLGGKGTLSSSTSWNGKLTTQEIEGAAYIGKKIGRFTPYGGVKYNNLSLEDRTGYGDREKVKAKKQFAPFVGGDIKVSKNFKLYSEVTFIGDKSKPAFVVGGTYRF